jgi:hypothetical protein
MAGDAFLVNADKKDCLALLKSGRLCGIGVCQPGDHPLAWCRKESSAHDRLRY